jgi:hypothetical protein
MSKMDQKFFVEFKFSYDLTGRTYWLPMYLSTNDKLMADRITSATKKALEERFSQVTHSIPIPCIQMTQEYINHKFDMHRAYEVEILNIKVWKFVSGSKDLSFNQQLKFIEDNSPFFKRTIAKQIGSYEFPVRVIKENDIDSPLEFEEYLLVNVVHPA